MRPRHRPDAVPDASPRSIHLDFEPARDGFSFSNSFAWTDDDLGSLSRSLRPARAGALAVAAAAGGAVSGGLGGAAAAALAGGALGAGGLGGAVVRGVAQRWRSFGLCGGMSLAAIERWPHRGGPRTADLQRDDVRALLRRRQEATLRASLGRFTQLWARVRAGRTGEAAAFPRALALELGRIADTLGAGRPALVGLVGDAPDPFAQHQVVVFGIDRRARLDATLQVYDPNAPGRARQITVAPAPGDSDGARITTTLPTGRRADGHAHISTRKGVLSHLFAIDA